MLHCSGISNFLYLVIWEGLLYNRGGNRPEPSVFMLLCVGTIEAAG
jgi:hypothetical protein